MILFIINLCNWCLKIIAFSNPFLRCICVHLVWINSTLRHPNNNYLNEQLLITDFNHKQEYNTSQDKNSIQTPNNDAKHRCKQQM